MRFSHQVNFCWVAKHPCLQGHQAPRPPRSGMTGPDTSLKAWGNGTPRFPNEQSSLRLPCSSLPHSLSSTFLWWKDSCSFSTLWLSSFDMSASVPLSWVVSANFKCSRELSSDRRARVGQRKNPGKRKGEGNKAGGDGRKDGRKAI